MKRESRRGRTCARAGCAARPRTRGAALIGSLAVVLAPGCGDPAPEPTGAASAFEPPAGEVTLPEGPFSTNAQLESHRMLLEDRAAPRHPSDGGGRAWLEPSEVPPVAGGVTRLVLLYEAGPAGIAPGGALYVQTSPFWGWDSPQTEWSDAPGFTRVSTEARDVKLSARGLGGGLLWIEVGDRALREGERVRVELGAGPAGLRVDRFAERDERIFVAVDGDGDGLRRNLDVLPALDVAAGPPADLVVNAPSVVRPGARFPVDIAFLDRASNRTAPEGAEVVFDPAPDFELPASTTFDAAHAGARRVELRAPEAEGLHRLRVRARLPGGELLAESNPVLVSVSAPRILWADLHGHSQLSDGTGTPDDWFRYARDVAGLDVAVLTDHDHWGMFFLDERPDLWESILASARRHHAPGRFVTLPGFEWTSWLHGHRHVLYFADDGPVVSSIDPETDDPAELWAALADEPALTFAHHSAGGPVATNWRFLPPPDMEPVTEVVSVHGSSEAADSPGAIYAPIPGNFVRDVLDRGTRFGFVGSGDGHDGHPGLSHRQTGVGGMAALFAEETTRDAVGSALRGRRCYATNGPRIWMRFSLDGAPMGAAVARATAETQRVELAVAGTAPIERLELVRSGVLLPPIEGDGSRFRDVLLEIPRLESGEYLYARVVQADGGAAWSSPIFVD